MRRSSTAIAGIAIVALFLMGWQVSPVSGAVIYVDDSAPASSVHDGTSWSKAFINLKHALEVAQAGDEIRMAKGTYRPAGPNGSREATYKITHGLVIQGGYAGYGTPNPNVLDPQLYKTVLNGDLAQNDTNDFVNYGENVYHVVTLETANQQTELRGLYIRSGNADLEADHNRGGGVQNLGTGTLIMKNCTLQYNRAYLSGAGGRLNGLEVHLTDCTIRENRNIYHSGGSVGLTCSAGSTLTNCTFEHNVAVTASNCAAFAGSGTTITGCTFINNSASDDGAAMIGSDFTIIDSNFIGNHSGWLGTVVLSGGNSLIKGCRFESNTAGEGGAIKVRPGAHADIIDCEFEENSADLQGGAIDVEGDANIIDCSFVGNHLDHPGGPAAALHVRGTAKLANCTFRQNFCDYGAAIYNKGTVTCVNTVFAGNLGSAAGVISTGSMAILTKLSNCTVAGHSSQTPGAVRVTHGALEMSNCILWDNSDDGDSSQNAQLVVGSDPYSLNNNCIMGWDGTLKGEGNTGEDPLLIDGPGADGMFGTEDDNLRLSELSPAINAGNNALLPADEFDLDGDGQTREPLSIDWDGHARIASGIVDLGSFEYQGFVCIADVAPSAGDGIVDNDDLLHVINSWGTCSGCAGDLTGNGTIDVDDLLAVINAWGNCS